MPTYISVGPLMPPKPANFTWVKRRDLDVRLTGERVGGKGKQAKYSKCPSDNLAFS